MTMCARSLTMRFFGSMPRSRSWEISRSRTIGSTTTPLPMMHVHCGYRIPEGISWNLNSPCSVMTVWPALLPPCERMTMSAFSARKSMTFPLPSSPHWPPTRMITKGSFRARFGPPHLQVVEAGVVAAELQLDRAGRSVAVLGYYDLGDPGPLVRLVVLRPEQEHHDVRVLLDAARLPEVAEDRSLVRPLLGRAAQLRDGDHRDPELTRQSLQSARDGRNLLDAIVVA